MSKGNSIERRIMLEALGAELVLVDQEEGGEMGKVTGGDVERLREEVDKIQEERGLEIINFLQPLFLFFITSLGGIINRSL